MENLTHAHVWKVKVRKKWMSHGGGHLCFQSSCSSAFQRLIRCCQFPPVFLHFSLLVLVPSRLFCCKAVKVKGTFGETLATLRGVVRLRLPLDHHAHRQMAQILQGTAERAAPWVSGKRQPFHWSALTSSFLHHLGKRLVQKRRTGSIRVAAGSSSEACHSNES